MKTKEKVVEKALSDFNAKHSSDDNWLKSRVQGAWNSGYRNGYEQCKMDTYKDIVSVPLEEIKREEYQRGLNDGGLLDVEKSISETYDNGFHDGITQMWNIVRFIESRPEDGGAKNYEIRQMFGRYYPATELYKTFSAEEAVHFYGEWLNQKVNSDISIGDEVESTIGKWVVTKIEEDRVFGIDAQGSLHNDFVQFITKTGRHFEFDLLEMMRE